MRPMPLCGEGVWNEPGRHVRFPGTGLLFGPVGRDAHQMSERVNARSLLEEVPAILQHFIEQVFANDGGM